MIILITYIAQVQSGELAAKYASDTQLPMDNLSRRAASRAYGTDVVANLASGMHHHIGNLVDFAFQVELFNHTDLDTTTLAKAQVHNSHGTLPTRPLIPARHSKSLVPHSPLSVSSHPPPGPFHHSPLSVAQPPLSIRHPPRAYGDYSDLTQRRWDLQTNSFDVIVFRSKKSRKLFRRLMLGFKYPHEGKDENWSPMDKRNARDHWIAIQRTMRGPGAEDVKHFVPVLAMSDGTPCGAALYDEPHMNEHDTFRLKRLLRNAGGNCSGGGAAILCNLIGSSIDKQREFSPLRLKPLVGMARWYESFGCTPVSDQPTKTNGKLHGELLVQCADPKPQRCEQHAGAAVDADEYFGDIDSILKGKSSTGHVRKSMSQPLTF